MNQYHLGRKAHRDLREIWKYVARDQRNRADRLIESFIDRFRLIAMNPQIGEARFDLHEGLRLLSAGNYVIGYERVRDGVRIVRVVHGARDLKRVFQG
jgi:toxin ParE1/3/4